MVATNADVQLQQMFDDLFLEIQVDQLDTSTLNREKQKKSAIRRYKSSTYLSPGFKPWSVIHFPVLLMTLRTDYVPTYKERKVADI